MGGLLFSTKRLPKAEFLPYLNKVEKLLHTNTDYDFFVPKWIEDKEDFGDLDIVVKNPIDIELLKTIFKPERFKSNGPVFSLVYKDFQIDFIKHTGEDYESAKNYYCYNDLGNLIGRLAQRFAMKFGPDGLRYVYYNGSKKLGEFNISKDMNMILEFLDLDFKKFDIGFETRKELFDFIIKSKYFNPYIYDMEHLNKINRDRNKKRTTYVAWLDYVEPLKKFFDKDGLFDGDKTIFIPAINSHFFNNSEFFDFIIEKDKEFELKRQIAEKFNGNIVMEITDLRAKKLGKFIVEFKAWIENTYKDFDQYVLDTTEEAIVKDIKAYVLIKNKLNDG